jgi:hypothetical protein
MTGYLARHDMSGATESQGPVVVASAPQKQDEVCCIL